MYWKLISGSDALYSVQYAFHAAPTPARAEMATAYLKSVSACDTRLPDRPCRLR